MNYPLTFRFKLLAFSPQIYVTDSTGNEVCYVKQKAFRLKEKVEVFTTSAREHLLSTIEADRIIDIRARYHFRDAAGRDLGSFRRRGLRSIWRTNCEVYGPDAVDGAPALFTIREENPFAKMLDGFISEIPIVGFISGYICHPRYVLSRADGTAVARLTKQAAFFEGLFKLEKLSDMTREEELVCNLSFLMMNLLERSRG